MDFKTVPVEFYRFPVEKKKYVRVSILFWLEKRAPAETKEVPARAFIGIIGRFMT